MCVRDTAETVRGRFEARDLDRDLLARLYRDYADVGDVKQFVDQVLEMFPRLSCGVASVYLRHELGKGAIIQGGYGSHDHTFLRLGDGTIIDITADQYGGPKTYVGTLVSPWSLG